MASGGLEDGEAESLLAGYLESIGDLLGSLPPPFAGASVYRDLRSRLIEADIFAKEKAFLTAELLGRAPGLRSAFGAGPERLCNALRAATWGNLLDVAQGRPLPDLESLLALLGGPLALDRTGEFMDRLGRTRRLLVLGDNAGETVLDALFLECLPEGMETVYMVRPEPVLNDATVEDARAAGIGGRVEVVSSGLDAPAVRPEMLSDKALECWNRSELILAKGQGNLEGLWGTIDPRLYHSFVVKCDVISEMTGLPEGSGVLAGSAELHERRCVCRSTSSFAADAT